MKKLIAISGGIGSGKSVVSKILTHMHYCVYDCDSRAKILMDTSSTIKQQLKELISPEVINFNNDINRPLLSQIVFNNSTALATLNNIVHSAVKEDLLNWFQNVDSNIAFVETAILYAQDLNTEHNKFNQFWYYKADVRFKGEEFPLYVNVGKAKNDGSFHIYDITKKSEIPPTE